MHRQVLVADCKEVGVKVVVVMFGAGIDSRHPMALFAGFMPPLIQLATRKCKHSCLSIDRRDNGTTILLKFENAGN